MIARPKRKAIPQRIRRIIEHRQNGLCFCGCNRSIMPGSQVEWDHSPALQLRPINAAGTDYIPAQLDPAHIVARCPASHKCKTFGLSKATSLNSDIHAIAKTKRLSGERAPKKFKRSIPPRTMPGTKASGIRKKMNGDVERR